MPMSEEELRKRLAMGGAPNTRAPAVESPDLPSPEVGPDVIYKAIKMSREPQYAQQVQEDPKEESDVMSTALLAALPTLVGGLFGGAGGVAAGGAIGASAVQSKLAQDERSRQEMAKQKLLQRERQDLLDKEKRGQDFELEKEGVKAGLDRDKEQRGYENRLELQRRAFAERRNERTDQEKSKPISDTHVSAISDTDRGIEQIDKIIDLVYKNKNIIGPVVGRVTSIPLAGKYATESKNVQAEIARVRQVIGKAIEGGVLRKEDEEKYKDIVGEITDSPEVLIAKLRSLSKDLQLGKSTLLKNLEKTGRNVSKFSESSPARDIQREKPAGLSENLIIRGDQVAKRIRSKKDGKIYRWDQNTQSYRPEGDQGSRAGSSGEF